MGATFDMKSQAHAWAKATERALRAAEALPGEAPPGDRDFVAAVDEFQSVFEKRERLSAASKYMYFHAAGRLRKAFSGKTLAGLTRDDVERYRDRRLEEVGASTIRHDFVFLRQLYKHARLDWGISLPCPIDDVAASPPPQNREVDISPAEISRLLDFCRASAAPLLYSDAHLLLLTGMRPSEAASLRRDQVRLEERRIVLTKTKTGKRRNEPLARAAVEQLERLRMEMPGPMVFFTEEDDMPEPPSNHFASQFKKSGDKGGLAGNHALLVAAYRSQLPGHAWSGFEYRARNPWAHRHIDHTALHAQQ